MRSGPMAYRSGVEIRKGDRVLMHGEAGQVEVVLDGESNPADWPAKEYGRGVVITEPKVVGRLFLSEEDLAEYEDLEFVSRSS